MLNPFMPLIVHHLLLLTLLTCLSACVSNKPHRTEFETRHCFAAQADCSRSIIEQHLVFDLAFVEFTERGNLYDRAHVRQVMDFVHKQAESENGAAVFVFVHGWKHNASHNDSNVVQFRDFLARAAENEIVGKRKVVGVYLGWRGNSNNIPVLRETTYWARKSVAEEIGDGGATEIFSELHQILVRQYAKTASVSEKYKNTYVIIGHSFGAAIVLSAMHDVLLNELIAAANGQRDVSAVNCDKINRFADGLILLNPAIEANKIILLKEATARCQFNKNQPKLLHVLSSDADFATKLIFPIGQLANPTTTLGPKKLKRQINDRQITINEHHLNIRTAGNLEQLRTDYLAYDHAQRQWLFTQCRQNLEDCGVIDTDKQLDHFPINQYDPLRFIKTDVNFIKNHNDVFGCYVQSFITATIFETQSIDSGYITDPGTNNGNNQSKQIDGCDHLNFDFKRCFNNQLDDYDCDPPT